MLEDGIGTMDVSTISADHAVAAEVLFADQVEIFRGSSALLYGSGASGGVVNIVNHRIPERLPDEAGAICIPITTRLRMILPGHSG